MNIFLTRIMFFLFLGCFLFYIVVFYSIGIIGVRVRQEIVLEFLGSFRGLEGNVFIFGIGDGFFFIIFGFFFQLLGLVFLYRGQGGQVFVVQQGGFAVGKVSLVRFFWVQFLVGFWSQFFVDVFIGVFGLGRVFGRVFIVVVMLGVVMQVGVEVLVFYYVSSSRGRV